MQNFRRLLYVALSFLVAPAALHAQDSLDVKSARLILSEYRIDLTLVHDKVWALAEAIPTEKYAWRPTASVRSVSEVLMHVAGEWFYICPISVGGKPPADFGAPREAMPKLEKITSKSEVLEQLQKSWAFCTAAFGSADPTKLLGKYEPVKMSLARAVLRVGGDQHEHVGQLITYARSVGVTPPWSK
ncbi:MAG: DinB family protein [Gemmatimonadaceae bacterium]